jgi:hypothetical protein
MTHAEAIKVLTRWHDAAWETMHALAIEPHTRALANRDVDVYALAIRALERDGVIRDLYCRERMESRR